MDSLEESMQLIIEGDKIRTNMIITQKAEIIELQNTIVGNNHKFKKEMADKCTEMEIAVKLNTAASLNTDLVRKLEFLDQLDPAEITYQYLPKWRRRSDGHRKSVCIEKKYNLGDMFLAQFLPEPKYPSSNILQITWQNDVKLVHRADITENTYSDMKLAEIGIQRYYFIWKHVFTKSKTPSPTEFRKFANTILGFYHGLTEELWGIIHRHSAGILSNIKEINSYCPCRNDIILINAAEIEAGNQRKLWAAELKTMAEEYMTDETLVLLSWAYPGLF